MIELIEKILLLDGVSKCMILVLSLFGLVFLVMVCTFLGDWLEILLVSCLDVLLGICLCRLLVPKVFLVASLVFFSD